MTTFAETITTYNPSDEVLVQTEKSGTAYGFTGEQEDGAAGLLYLRARYYSAEDVHEPRPVGGDGVAAGYLPYRL